MAPDEEQSHLALRKARHQIQTGEITREAYQQLEEGILRSLEVPPATSYGSLVTSQYLPPISQGGSSEHMSHIGYLTTKQEEQYQEGLDAFLDGKAPNPRPYATNNLGHKHPEKNADREREMQLRNPVSVYNWLRKHQPQVFLQDNEAGGDKQKTAPRASKRAAANIKQDPEMYDEDGIALDGAAASRGKRKRDEDSGYRPKGGSNRLTKRKREEGGSITSMKRPRKSTMMD